MVAAYPGPHREAGAGVPPDTHAPPKESRHRNKVNTHVNTQRRRERGFPTPTKARTRTCSEYTHRKTTQGTRKTEVVGKE